MPRDPEIAVSPKGTWRFFKFIGGLFATGIGKKGDERDEKERYQKEKRTYSEWVTEKDGITYQDKFYGTEAQWLQHRKDRDAWKTTEEKQ